MLRPATKLPLQDVYITGMGHYHPENVIENSFFDQLDIGSEADWVKDRTGIEARRSVLRPEDLLAVRRGSKDLAQLRQQGLVMGIGELGRRAWQDMAAKKFDVADIDALVCGTSVPDFDIPANASTIAAAVGVECSVWDVNSACSSFVTNLHVNRALVATGLQKKLAIVVAERYSLRLDYSDRRTAVLFGDGCAAAILQPSFAAGALRVVDTMVVSTPSKFALVQIPDGGSFDQNGQAVQKFAVTKTAEVTRQILARNDLKVGDMSYFIGHQANLRMLHSVVQKLGVSDECHLYNVDQFGNQGGAGAPAVLSSNWHKLQPGDLVVVAVVGSGLTWGAAILEFVAP